VIFQSKQFAFPRFEKLFDDECYLIVATTHPFFKIYKRMSGEAAKSTKLKLKHLIFEALTPVEELNR
jgi:hypothetical protein